MNGLSWIDWTVMLGTLFTIVAYGVWKTRGAKNIEGYLLGGKESNWWTIGLSVMATQASAITFLAKALPPEDRTSSCLPCLEECSIFSI